MDERSAADQPSALTNHAERRDGHVRHRGPGVAARRAGTQPKEGSRRDLGPARSAIADELSKQYYLGYPSSGKKDGRWHSIRVTVRNGSYRVRARRGYLAS